MFINIFFYKFDVELNVMMLLIGVYIYVCIIYVELLEKVFGLVVVMIFEKRIFFKLFVVNVLNFVYFLIFYFGIMFVV